VVQRVDAAKVPLRSLGVFKAKLVSSSPSSFDALFSVKLRSLRSDVWPPDLRPPMIVAYI